MNPHNTPLEGTKLSNFTPLPHVPALQVIDLQEGSGAAVQPGTTITAHYTGALAADGTIFQSSHDFGDPATFGACLSQLAKRTAYNRQHRTFRRTLTWCSTSNSWQSNRLVCNGF